MSNAITPGTTVDEWANSGRTAVSPSACRIWVPLVDGIAQGGPGLTCFVTQLDSV